jgi:DNA-binding transcriptional LysR family regulator
MDLSDLKIFSAVVHAGGITRAAERLHRVQSSVTTRIRQLEDELGVELFIREGKRLHLTAAGRILLGYAGQMLALAEEAETAVRDRSPRGLFRLGAMDSTAAVRLPGPLAEYSRRHPNVVLELRTGNPEQLARALLDHQIDAALVAEPIPDVLFEKIAAFEEEPVIVASADHPPIAADRPAPKAVIVFEHGCPHRKRLEAWYATRGEMPERIVELGSYHAMLGCVVAGMGVALLPRSVLETFPESRRLTVYPLLRRDRILTVMIWRKGVRSPNITALAEILTARRGSAKVRSAPPLRNKQGRRDG